MARRRKYRDGSSITSMADLASLLLFNQYVMLDGVPKHRNWIERMTFFTLNQMIVGNRLRVAERISPE